MEDLQALKSRHMAIMDAMVAHPEKTQEELAGMLKYHPTTLSKIVNAPLFKMAFAQYRKRFEKNLAELVHGATEAAVKFSQEVVEDPEVPIPIKQISARDILAQGHAKAVERRASMHMDIEVPQEMFGVLAGVAKELEAPFEPRKLLQRPEEPQEEDLD